MRVVIFTNGRFHVLDLARELTACGHDVTFISCLPPGRVEKFGFPGNRHRSHFVGMLPLLLMKRYAGSLVVREWATRQSMILFDQRVARSVPPCDVCIGMAGMSLQGGQAAQKRYKSLYIVERGSRHILSQKEILEAIPGWPPDRPGVPTFDVAQNLAEYEAADIIAVPATHVVESFLEKGIARSKLFCNPYGVDLEMFPPTRKDTLAPSTVLYVGAWSMQKGVDILLSACKTLKNVRLLHVGSKGDGPPFPTEPFFRHVDSVPQWELKCFYAMADVFVQPSRQEGLSLVQAQSLSCGLPLVCTDRTGGADLRDFLPDPSMVTVVPHDDAPALAQGITLALERARGSTGLRQGLGKARELLSWKAYGRRYSNFLERRVRTKQV